MKEIRTIRMVEQTEVKFVADDGKEFLTEQECRDYERRGGETKVAEAFQKLDVVKLQFPLVSWFSDESEMWKVTLNCKCEFVALMDYLDVVEDICEFRIDEPTEYPCTKILSLESEYVYEYDSNLKEELQAVLAQLQ